MFALVYTLPLVQSAKNIIGTIKMKINKFWCHIEMLIFFIAPNLVVALSTS